MPPRLVSIAILLFWVVAVSSLIRRDILPELGFVRPPDLRTIAKAEERAEAARWSVEVIDNPLSPENRRAVGEAETDAKRRPDGWVVVASKVIFDAEGLLKGTPFWHFADEKIEVLSQFRIDPSGNLGSFEARMRAASDHEDLIRVEGRLKNRAMEIMTRGISPLLNQTRTIPYEPRSLVQNVLGPFDRLPGLQVGQLWETRMVSPLTGRVDTVRVEVKRRTVIHWDKSPVTTFEVVHHLAPLSARTWVRTDGLVLRQEVPFPFVKLVLERLPDRTPATNAEVPDR
jgi:hypothetical protein